MDASVAALLGALIGGLAGVAGQVLAARYASRNERRRLAVEAGYREWEHVRDVMKDGGGRLLPPILFIHYSYELMTLLDEGALSAESYRDVLRRRDSFRAVIEEDNTPQGGNDDRRHPYSQGKNMLG